MKVVLPDFHISEVKNLIVFLCQVLGDKYCGASPECQVFPWETADTMTHTHTQIDSSLMTTMKNEQ